MATRRLVLDFADPRPTFGMAAWVPEHVRAVLPADWELVPVEVPISALGDGATAASPAALAAVRDAEVYMGFGVPADIVRAGVKLRWVHTGNAGVGSALTPELVGSDIVFTNSAGVHAPPMAETVIGMILHFARGLDHVVRGQARGRWDKDAFDTDEPQVREVAGSVVGILGLGGIGREVAARAAALGARVLALRRRPAEPPPGVELLYGDAGLSRLLEASDFLVVSAPETRETRRLIDRAALARMKPGAVLVNVARGGLVDEAALVQALAEGRLRGAALDVFTAEPLPAEHPLWRLPNVLITPHISSYSHRFWEREASLITQNVRRYLDGRPLLNVVDKLAGY